MKENKISIYLVTTAFLSLVTHAQAQDKRPNVIVMIADDLGYGDVSCLARQIVKTPNIDRMAQLGVKFSSGYVAVPLSGPSRASFYSGQYPQKIGFSINSGSIPTDIPLLPGVLKQAGYHTGLLGKWHSKGPMPYERGCFDETLCSANSSPFIDYYQPKLARNGKVDVYNEYSTDLFAREAEDFIDRNKDNPFQLTVAFNAPHIRKVVVDRLIIEKKFLQDIAEGKPAYVSKASTARPGDIEKYSAQFLPDSARADAVACITALDQAVGRILDKVQKAGIANNTIIFFFGDNGAHPENRSENLPLRDYKWTDYEGGIRVPFFVVYPGVFPARLDFKQPVCTFDIFPTLMALTGIKPPANLDGVNLVPYITGKSKSAPHDALFFSFEKAGAVRQGNWKLVLKYNEQTELYDLSKDIKEKNNLASKNQKLVNELMIKWKDWAKKTKVTSPIIN